MADLPEVVQFKWDLLAKLLSQCTPKQRDIQILIWKNFKEIPETSLDANILLIKRIIAKNNTMHVNQQTT